MALRGTTADGTFTFDIRQGAGGTGGTANVAGLNSIGTRTTTFSSAGTTSTYYTNFDTPVSFVADTNSTSLVISFASTGKIDWKSEASGGGRLARVNTGNGNFFGTESVRFSVAGSAVPEPSTALLGALGALAMLRRRR
jgi:hypothetical protein